MTSRCIKLSHICIIYASLARKNWFSRAALLLFLAGWLRRVWADQSEQSRFFLKRQELKQTAALLENWPVLCTKGCLLTQSEMIYRSVAHAFLLSLPLSRLEMESSSEPGVPVASSSSLLEMPMQRDSFRHSSVRGNHDKQFNRVQRPHNAHNCYRKMFFYKSCCRIMTGEVRPRSIVYCFVEQEQCIWTPSNSAWNVSVPLFYASCSGSYPAWYCNLNQLQEAIGRGKEVGVICDSRRVLVLGKLDINTLSNQMADWTGADHFSSPCTGKKITVKDQVTQRGQRFVFFYQRAT